MPEPHAIAVCSFALAAASLMCMAIVRRHRRREESEARIRADAHRFLSQELRRPR